MKKIITPQIAIRGAGGDDSSSQRVPKEASDTLQSSASAQVLDLVSEGEIEGLVDGAKSIFLDGTPIQNPDGTFNFSGISIYTRNGTQAQDYIPGQSDTENEISVGVEVKKGSPGPIVRSITNSNVDAVRVIVSFPQLSNVDPGSGDLGGVSLNYAIDVQSNGAGYVEMLNQTIYGKSMSKYQRSHRIALAGSPPWDIRVRRLTDDSLTVNRQNKTVWESYAEIEDVKLSYPNSALVGMRVKASQFSSVPSRAYDLKLLKIQVPSNYDPVTKTYSGSWDGTFDIAWTDNPAWIFYDLVTSERYGLGGFIPADQVDKWSLYTIGRYCDEYVDDGFGGTEPRFTCNIYLQSRADAFKVINDLSSVFRGMAYWASGSLTLSQDSPQDASYLFTPANVIDGKFNYVGASAKARHTVALVTWNDPEDFFRQKVEYVEDQDAISRFGIIETQVVAMGCTSRGQAHRLGKWLLYTEKYQSETIGFQTGIEGATLRPGQVIKVADPVRAGSRRGGRISAGTLASITIDDSTLTYSSGMTLSMILPDNTVDEREVVSILAGVVTVSSNFSSTPQKDSIWMISTAAIEPQQFRVISVLENKDQVFEITAIAHDPEKFDFVDFDAVLAPRSISNLRATPDSPSDLLVTETLYAVGKDVRVKVTLSWKPVGSASSYLVQWRRDSQNFILMPETSSNEIEIFNAEPGAYDFIVYAVSGLGKRSVPSNISAIVRGRGVPPLSVENFSLIPQSGMAYLTWDQAVDLDVLIGGAVRIRYSPELVSPAWKNSVDILPALPGTATHASVPLLSGTYMAKFVDSSNIASDDEAVIITTLPTALALNVVQTVTEDPGFSGTKTAMEYRTDLIGLTLASTTLIDDITDIDTLPAFDFLGGVSPTGEYLFAGSVDLGSVLSSKLTVGINATSYDVTDTIDQRLDDADDWLDLDGDFIDDVNAVVYMRSTLDNPAGSPTWTAWKPFFVGEYTARAYQFKVIATSGNPSHSIVITALSVTVDMPDRAISLNGIVSGVATYSVVFEAPFYVTPALGISAHNMISGDYYVLANKTKSGFDITFKNAANATVSRTFDFVAKGYGRAS
ncbi:MAG: host specificity protein J [Bdellovibrionales bacterium]